MFRGPEPARGEYLVGILSRLLLVAAGLVQTIAISRYLGPGLKGELAFDLSVISVLTVVFSFGLFDAYAYFRRRAVSESQDLDQYRQAFAGVVLLIYISLAVAAIIGVLASLALGSTWAKPALYALSTPLWAFSLVSSYIMLIENPNRRNRAFVVAAVIDMTLALGLLLTSPRYFTAAFLAAAAVEAGKAVYFGFASFRGAAIRKVSVRQIGGLLKFGFFPMLSVLLTTMNYRVDVLMLGLSGQVSMAAIGVYSVGMALAEKSMAVSDSMREVLTSRLAAGRGPGEVAVVIRVCLALTLAVAAAMVGLGDPFFRLLYGGDFADAYGVTVVVLMGTVWMVFFKMISQYNVLQGRQAVNAGLLAIGVGVNVAANWALIPLLGVMGSAVATALSYCLCGVMFILDFRAKAHVRIRDLFLLRRSDLSALWR